MDPTQPQAADPSAGAQDGDPTQQQPGGGGPQPTKDIGFNQQIQNVLFSRIQTLTPDEVDSLDEIVTPQTYPILIKIFPELKPLFDQSTAATQGQGGQQGAQPAPQGNPLTNDNVSRGLTGGAGG